MATHRAAVLLAKGGPFQILPRSTPRPGPGELLVAVKSVALNPADHIMTDHGLFIPPSSFPTVIGFDMAGLVLEVGEGVPVQATNGRPGPCFQPGITRVAAYSASAWRSCLPDYGPFQEHCLVPWQHAVPLPDNCLSWNEAATLPVSVVTSLSAWDALGLPRLGEAATSAAPEDPKEAILVWGASSSVGSMGVQSARLMKEDSSSPVAAVYATAGAANKEYIGELGADRVFDYNNPQVVEEIVSAAKKDGLVIRHCFLAKGELTPCQAVLKAFIQEGRGKAKIASAPPVPADAEAVEGLDVLFIMPSGEKAARCAEMAYWMGTWLGGNLAQRKIKPSPKPQVIGKGLESLNTGLDVLRKGVSCTKLVVEIAE